MLQEYSAILSSCIKLPSVFDIFILSIFEWLLKTGFTVFCLKVKLKALARLCLCAGLPEPWLKSFVVECVTLDRLLEALYCVHEHDILCVELV